MILPCFFDKNLLFGRASIGFDKNLLFGVASIGKMELCVNGKGAARYGGSGLLY